MCTVLLILALHSLPQLFPGVLTTFQKIVTFSFRKVRKLPGDNHSSKVGGTILMVGCCWFGIL